ncbi:hypothetical protein BC828DRAFT_349906 [Blastocladiella britannica]|nr:hypothetical protein BC828DRAFT_349906 [Blastocladiella britannica]
MDSPPVAAKSPKSKKKQTTGSAAASTSVQGKLRSSKDIMNRLLWDKAAYDPNDYVVGYLDRFDGIMERALLAFKPDDESDPDWVPMHRIVHFRRVSDNVKVWDRKNKIDLVFHR